MAEVDGKNALYEILKMELQAKNEQIAVLQAELSKERQHSRELAEKIVVLADQAQKLQLAQMSQQLMDNGSGAAGAAELKRSKSWWSRIFRKHRLTK